MKRFTLLIFFIVSICGAFAQNISVKSFKALPMDLTASSLEGKRVDQNGDVAALIKVVTTETGFVFEGGTLGIVDTKQTPGEVWVWVPRAARKITIKHPKLGVLRDYYYPVEIEAERTFEMVLTTAKIETIVKEEVTQQYLIFELEPKNATLEVNDQLWSVDADGTALQFVDLGTYTYRVRAANYETDAGVVTVDDPNPDHPKTVKVKLKSNFAEVTLTVDADAEIWVNNDKKGVRSWTGSLGKGTYKIECKQKGHETSLTTKEITAAMNGQTITLSAPVPIYGSLNVESTPIGATIYIDGKEIGKTPRYINEVLIGQRALRLMKEGYEEYSETVTITKGERKQVKAVLNTILSPPVTENLQQIVDSNNSTYIGHDYVDLGLPSGTLWATCNVGASAPEECGDYYAWGETTTKSMYNWSTYKYCKGRGDKLTKYCSNSSYGNNGFTDNLTILQSNDDASLANWGRDWCMPTREQWEELINNTTITWITQNGVKGRKFTASNDNSLFLPAAGCLNGNYLDNAGNNGYYWSSSLNTSYPGSAWCLRFGSSSCYVSSDCYRDNGRSVRLVHSATTTGIEESSSHGTKMQTILKYENTFTIGDVSFTMVLVEGGSFQMGATFEQGSDVNDVEKPSHNVTLSSYYLGETEVTQALWKAVMESEPIYQEGWEDTYGKGNDYPAYSISWDDIQEFIRRLNQKTGKNFRLPTEAEWEFAARGGKKSNRNKYAGCKYANSKSLGSVAWFSENSNSKTHVVKTKLPNESGLYDMSGNVQEWCQDWFGNYESKSQTNPQGSILGSSRVLRGGSWNLGARNCRVSDRSFADPDRRSSDIGFRLALSE